MSMRIGEVAGRVGVGIETIRYYEREGLLAVPRRRPSGYREYDESAIARLHLPATWCGALLRNHI